jgi:hypothetical protein
MNYRYINDFISDSEREELLRLGKQFESNSCVEITNEHIKKINEGTKGFSILCDMTHTDVSETIAKFQGDATTIETVPDFFHEIADRISKKVGLSKNHIFCQYIVLGAGGRVPKHYDAGMPGYVTYKCNVCISGPETDLLCVDKSEYDLRLGDLYCFEANFYKHWMNASDSARVVLSYGFIVPLEELGYKDTDPRVRMSNRIWKAFISSNKRF